MRSVACDGTTGQCRCISGRDTPGLIRLPSSVNSQKRDVETCSSFRGEKFLVMGERTISNLKEFSGALGVYVTELGAIFILGLARTLSVKESGGSSESGEISNSSVPETAVGDVSESWFVGVVSAVVVPVKRGFSVMSDVDVKVCRCTGGVGREGVRLRLGECRRDGRE